ncbi:hypothetical protein Pcinc_027626 [Petrolisthes cinctipes]|uniref:Fidgetin-like protein 1 n=1 Tax=Petrolisthes cinctipes TaxID=88211 RepID=A0AAE1F4R2_PETCI|nr:hypothetical protein Pcinc_027626 [Petrolisthes cinctipes]
MEAGDVFLHLWQKRNLESENGGNGGPGDKTEALRFNLVQLYYLKMSSSDIDDLAVLSKSRQLLQEYGNLIDGTQEEGGLNNYAEPIMALVANSKNESKEWKCGLQAQDVVRKYLTSDTKDSNPLEEEYNKLADLLNKAEDTPPPPPPPAVESKVKPRMRQRASGPQQDSINAYPSFTLMESDVLDDTEVRFPPGIPVTNGSRRDEIEDWGIMGTSSGPVTRGRGHGGPYPWNRTGRGGQVTSMSTGDRSQTTAIQGSRSYRGGGGGGGWRGSDGGRGGGYNRNTGSHSGYGYSGNGWREEDIHDIPNGRPTTCKPRARGGQERNQWSRRGNEEEELRSAFNSGPNSCFKTASHQMVLEQQKKFGRGGMTEAAYGSGKRSLGVRRTVNTKFVPPVRRDDEDEYGGELMRRCMPQASGKGRGVDEESPYAYLMTDDRLKNIDIKMVELIMNEIMDNGPTVTWDDIAGLDLAKTTIQEIVVWPMLRPDIFTGLRGPPKGLLLFGPPGTGKTMIGKCIASQSGSTFFSISASSLTSKWVGEGEKMVRAMFAVARCHQPAVIFIDEIDSLLTQRSDTEHESSRRIKTEFLVQLDGATTESEERLLVVGATNRPQELDEAARRRLVKKLYIPLPEEKARQQIIEKLLSNQSHSLGESEVQQVCQQTNGYSGADMANLCREAALGPIRSINFADIHHISIDQVRPITVEDFIKALSIIKPSVSDRDLQLYEDWNAKYGISAR